MKMNLTNKIIDQAARSFGNPWDSRERTRAALIAVVPGILEELANELMAERDVWREHSRAKNHDQWLMGNCNGMLHAVFLVRESAKRFRRTGFLLTAAQRRKANQPSDSP